MPERGWVTTERPTLGALPCARTTRRTCEFGCHRGVVRSRSRVEVTHRAGDHGVRDIEAGFVVEDGRSRVYVRREDSLKGDLEDERVRSIESVIPRPAYYTVEFSDIALCRVILMAIVDDPDLFVDNDHGHMLRGADFLSLLRARPDWDWRVPAQDRR
jgi:hypothetical protein